MGKSATTTVAKSGHVVAMSGNTITGGSSTFSQHYQVGDIIRLTDGTNPFSGSSGTEDHRITQIVSDTSIRVANTISATRSGLGTSDAVSHRQVFPTGYVYDTFSNGNFSSTSTQHTINLQQANVASSFSASVYFNVLRSNAVQTAKTVRKGQFITINTQTHSTTNNGPWPLGVADVFKLEAVYMGSDTSSVTINDSNVTSHFILDTGQKDDMYDTSKLVKKSTSSLNITCLLYTSPSPRDRG